MWDSGLVFFFFQAEDGIRDYKVTGVQTCALPICPRGRSSWPSRPIWLVLRKAEASSYASLTYITYSLSGQTGSVALRYDPPDSSSSSPGTIPRRLSPSGQLATTIGAWFTRLVLKGASAFPGFPVSHPCVTPPLVSVLPAAAPASSLPFPTTWCVNAADSVGCHAESRAASQALEAEIGRACVGKECRSRWSPYH